jgi:probable rRNA maturation factor
MGKQIRIFNKHHSIRLRLGRLQKQIAAILRILKLRGSSIELTFVDDGFMTEQNKRHMHKRGTTDVLSFPQLAATPQNRHHVSFTGVFLGDVLISLDQARRQASCLKISLNDEVLFLTLHSILHLIGYDHANRVDQCEMQGIESAVWGRIKMLKG